MHIVVCVCQVPDPQAPAGSFYVDEAAMEPRWSPAAQPLLSTFDLHAVEAAACLKEAHGATVTALTVAGPEAEPGLRRALAAGCDQAVRVAPPAGAGHDRLAIAHSLAAAIRTLPPADLVLCGRIAAGWDMGHVPAMLAEVLGFPYASPVTAIEARDDGASVELRRLTVDGYEVVHADLPLVAAVSNEINEPRYPTMRSVLDAQRATITVADGAVAADATAARLTALRPRDLSAECELIDGETAEDRGMALAAVMHERGFV
ncbi:MAG: electron transfer flavoprotein subunit beta/FixA family protein [Dehalococcoidia bacterium]|nr:electron transfer flavoprotein subunit beta/FixA family protein [Dehalococcoidia bacterium]